MYKPIFLSLPTNYQRGPHHQAEDEWHSQRNFRTNQPAIVAEAKKLKAAEPHMAALQRLNAYTQFTPGNCPRHH